MPDARAVALLAEGREAAEAWRFGEAAIKFDEALGLDPGLTAAQVARALLIWETTTDAEAALSQLDLIAETAPEDANLHQARAALLNRMGRFDESRLAADNAHRLRPDYAMPLLSLAELGPVSEGDPLIAAAHRIADDPEAATADRSIAHYALGKAYEDMGQSDRAALHVHLANDLNTTAFEPEKSRGVLLRNRKVYPIADVQRPESGATPRMIFILGMPRSGTTLVERILGAHPDVAMGGERQELILLARAFLKQATGAMPDQTPIAALQQFHTAQNLGLLRDSYVSRASSGADRTPYFTDKNPGNIWNIGLIEAAFPDAILLHVRRDPLDCCWSCYKAAFGRGLGFTNNQAALGTYYRHYHAMMTHWHKVFPGRILDLGYETLVSDPGSQTRRILDHCGLDWHPACATPENTPGAVATASSWQVRQPIHARSVNASRAVAPWLGPLIEALGGLEWIERAHHP